MLTELDPNTALVLIDLQKAVLQYPLITPARTILANTAKLITAFREAHLPIVIVTVQPTAADTSRRRNGRRSVGAGFSADMLALAPEVETKPGDIFIAKHTWGAFHETPLEDELTKHGITGLVLAGVATSRGVESTARTASERGYTLTFAQDAMTDTLASAHENSVSFIFPRLGEVSETKAIVAYLEKEPRTNNLVEGK